MDARVLLALRDDGAAGLSPVGKELRRRLHRPNCVGGDLNTHDRSRLERPRVSWRDRRRESGLRHLWRAVVLLVALTALSSGCGAQLTGPWQTTVLARHLLFGPDGAVPLPHSPYVLGFEPESCVDPCPSRIERLDLDNYRVRSGPEFSAYTDLVLLGQRAAVVSARQVAADGNVSGGWLVTTLSLARLTSGVPRPLPIRSPSAGWEAAAGSSNATIWVSPGRQIDLVEATTGRVLASVPVPFEVASLATDPDGNRLYVLGTPARKAPLFLDEYDARNGHLLATFSERVPAGNAPTLTPTNEGVWLVPGNAPPQLFRREGLGRVHLRAGTLPPSGFGAYQDSVTDLGAFVLIKSESGESCVSAQSGRLRAKASWSLGGEAPNWSALEIRRGRLLVLSLRYPHVVGGPVPSDVGVLSSVKVPAACFGA